MKKQITATVLAILFITLFVSNPSKILSATKPEKRCGWFVDPTPANASLWDADGEWILGFQGGYQAEGQENWTREYKPSEWVETNGIHGYGCACMKVTTNKEEMQIVRVFTAWPRPLSACTNDRRLKAKLPNWPN